MNRIENLKIKNEFDLLYKNDNLLSDDVILFKTCLTVLYSMSEFIDTSDIFFLFDAFEIANLILSKEYNIIKNITNILKKMKLDEKNERFHEIGIKYLTVYAFSTENWKRPAEEVGALMKLFRQYLVDSLTDFREDDIKVVFIGDRSAFDSKLVELINESEEVAKDRKGMLLNIAMNYGSRDEILRAVKMISRDVRDNKLDPDKITEEDISSRLYTANLPDPDLIIRTGGEFRLSNFMLYQSAYSEFYSTETLWPDFHEEDFDNAVIEYNRRNRRFGGV